MKSPTTAAATSVLLVFAAVACTAEPRTAAHDANALAPAPEGAFEAFSTANRVDAVCPADTLFDEYSGFCVDAALLLKAGWFPGEKYPSLLGLSNLNCSTLHGRRSKNLTGLRSANRAPVNSLLVASWTSHKRTSSDSEKHFSTTSRYPMRGQKKAAVYFPWEKHAVRISHCSSMRLGDFISITTDSSAGEIL